MPSERNAAEWRKWTAIVPNLRRSNRARAQSPRVPWPGIVLAVIALVLIPGLAGTQALGAEGNSAAGASRMSAAQLLSTLASEPATPQQPAAADGSSTSAPLTLTLKDALERAEKYSPQFQAAVTATRMARASVTQARSTLLPSADYTTQELLTQGNGKVPTGRYVTNDGVHVYRSWGVFRQTFSADTFTLASYRAATAAQDIARAQQEIAQRGLKVAVTQAYYALVVAERGYGTAQQGLDQAHASLESSQELEKGGEVAHSDVITFQIQYNQQQQAFQEATMAMANARLALAVMLFPDFNQNFNVVDDLDTSPPLPTLEEAAKMAEAGNPEIRAAMAALRQSRYGVSQAKAAFLPTLSFDVDYGIEANAYALRSVASGFREAGPLPNLGFFMTATLNVPVWHWGANLSKLHQAQYQKQQAQVELSFAQRQVLKNLYSYYNEARTSRSELATLENSASLAAEGLRLNLLRYKSGEATVLDVLNAQNTLTLARNDFAAGLARYRVALANLQTLTGTF
ncbi:MAG: TolC family protein [Acidobacteria bacterium]|nr:MAG: TolC family protein [Acidobacteriota bacterium]